MHGGPESVELIFELDSLGAPVAAKQGVAALGLAGDLQVDLYGDAMDLDSALKEMERERRPHFQLKTGAASIGFCTVKAYQHQLLIIHREEPWTLSDWEGAIDFFLGCDGFTQACFQSEDYAFWQNAHDPLEYEVAGRSVDGLPLVSNGLPSPLNRLVVDTSRNPGRRVIRVGYVEMVGHAMWLGRPFWGIVGDDRRQELLAATAYQVTEMQSGVIRVVASEDPFVDETTREIQDDLRRILFGVAPPLPNDQKKGTRSPASGHPNA